LTAVAGLRRLGFSENEAKVYVTLMKHPGSTGYEVSRHSGVPRAKVYEVLEGLTARGAVLPEHTVDRTLYRVLPYTVLLQEHRRSTDHLLAELYRDLSRLTTEEDGHWAVTASGQSRVMSRAIDLITAAKHSLIAAGRPEELMALGPHLAEAERKGVAVQVLSRGPVRLAVQEIYVQTGRKGENSLAVLADLADLCLVDLTKQDDPYAVFITAPGIAQAVGGWIRREIAVGEIDRLVGERLGDLLPAAALQQMQRLWRS